MASEMIWEDICQAAWQIRLTKAKNLCILEDLEVCTMVKNPDTCPWAICSWGIWNKKYGLNVLSYVEALLGYARGGAVIAPKEHVQTIFEAYRLSLSS